MDEFTKLETYVSSRSKVEFLKALCTDKHPFTAVNVVILDDPSIPLVTEMEGEVYQKRDNQVFYKVLGIASSQKKNFRYVIYKTLFDEDLLEKDCVWATNLDEFKPLSGRFKKINKPVTKPSSSWVFVKKFCRRNT